MSLIVEQYDTDKIYLGQSKFSCGNDIIDKFVKSSLKKQVRENLSKAYVVLDSDNENLFVGFYTIKAFAVDASSLVALSKGSLPRTIPCLRLNMLGVSESYKKQGIGKKLLKHAIKTTLRVSDAAGVYGLYLDADCKAVDFYLKHSFVALTDIQAATSTPMFIALETIKHSLE